MTNNVKFHIVSTGIHAIADISVAEEDGKYDANIADANGNVYWIGTFESPEAARKACKEYASHRGFFPFYIVNSYLKA